MRRLRGQGRDVEHDTSTERNRRDIIALTFDYHLAHPELVRLVMDENMRHGGQVGSVAEARNDRVLPKTQALLDRGGAARPRRDATAD